MGLQARKGMISDEQPRTFEEYWETSPRFGELVKEVPTYIAYNIAAASYVAGQASAAKFFNEKLKERGL